MSQKTPPILRTLGTTYGTTEPTETTYHDLGQLGNTDRPAWRAWREMEPTANGLLAGSLALLLDPYVVATVQSGAIRMPLVSHLAGIWSTTLASIFGDRNTFAGVRRLLARQHARSIDTESLPPWYRDAYGDDPISPGDSAKRFAVMAALAGTVAKVHVATTLVTHGEDGTAYVADLQNTVADANRVTIPAEGPGGVFFLRTLVVAGETYANQPRMTREQAHRAGILGDDGVLQLVLNTDLGNGNTIRSLYPNFGGFVPEAVRDTLGLEWTQSDQRQLDDWAGTLADKVEGGTTKPLDWFDVAAKPRARR